jgi:hypothetical protein
MVVKFRDRIEDTLADGKVAADVRNFDEKSDSSGTGSRHCQL